MKEYEIRPRALLNRYLELVAEDAKNCFNKETRLHLTCVACDCNEATHQFDKSGFAYVVCSECGTLYQNPRPPLTAFDSFYCQSKSSQYWTEVFYPAVAEIRREKIFRPRVNEMIKLIEEKKIKIERLIDVGAGYGILLDEWRQRFPHTKSIAIEPSPIFAKECRAKGFEVVEEMAENVKGYDNFADLVICFEILEHVYDPFTFLQALKQFVRPGGYLFISTLSIDGFDLQTLWEKSNQIFPPHHINLLSIAGFEKLFQRAGLTETTISTPGELDVDIVRNAQKFDPKILNGQRFLHKLLNDDNSARKFQQFLVEQRMSSHVWIIGRKPSR